MTRPFLLLVFLLLAAGIHVPAAAQERTELQAFQDAAGNRSILFRGKQAARYAFPYNGHPYWRETAFRPGDICFEDNEYHDILININAVSQLALVKLPDSMFSVSLSPSLTSSFTMDGRRYVGVGPGEALPEGVDEVIGKGPEQVYFRIMKTLASSTNIANGDPIGYYDENYRYEVLTYFAIHKFFYFKDAEGNFTRFRSRNALLGKFPGRKREIRQALRDRLDTYERPSLETYCETFMNIVAP